MGMCAYSADGESPAFASEATIRARKPHKCCECGQVIAPGDTYERVKGCWNGDFQTYATCAGCVDVRKRCDSWIYGELWTDFDPDDVSIADIEALSPVGRDKVEEMMERYARDEEA